jgi:hypothetical protein
LIPQQEKENAELQKELDVQKKALQKAEKVRDQYLELQSAVIDLWNRWNSVSMPSPFAYCYQ